MKFVELTKQNLELAVKIQNQIFDGEDARENYLECINNDPYRKEIVNYIIYDDQDNPVGVVGLYSYHEYPDDAWLSWFGILPQYRGKNYGVKAFEFFEELGKTKGYQNIRVYTEAEFDKAINLYQKMGMIKEFYSHELESDEVNQTTIVLSKSLTNKPTEKWNNKFLELTAQAEKEK